MFGTAIFTMFFMKQHFFNQTSTNRQLNNIRARERERETIWSSCRMERRCGKPEPVRSISRCLISKVIFYIKMHWFVIFGNLSMIRNLCVCIIIGLYINSSTVTVLYRQTIVCVEFWSGNSKIKKEFDLLIQSLSSSRRFWMARWLCFKLSQE